MVFPLPNQSVDDASLVVQNHWNGQVIAEGLDKRSLDGLKNLENMGQYTNALSEAALSKSCFLTHTKLIA